MTATGEVQNEYDYDILGNPMLTIETAACSIRYAGEYLDNESGLYYLRARYYDSTIGRFISEDSYWGEDSNPLSLNLYTYAHNNPIRFIDPTGHAVLKQGSQGDGVVAVQEMLDELGYNTGGADGIYGKNTSAAVKKFQEDNGLQADGIISNQTLTYLKTMNAVKDAPDYAKNSAMESASKAEVGGIKDDTILMSTKTFEKAIENISGVRKTTGGGSVQTTVKNNQVEITGVTIPASDGKKIEVTTDKPSIAATATEDVVRFEEKVSIVKEVVQTTGTNTAVSNVSKTVTAITDKSQEMGKSNNSVDINILTDPSTLARMDSFERADYFAKAFISTDNNVIKGYAFTQSVLNFPSKLLDALSASLKFAANNSMQGYNDPELTDIMVDSYVYGMLPGQVASGLVSTLRGVTGLATIGEVTPKTINGFSAVESKTINEAKTIINSADFMKIKAAHEAGQSVSVNIGGRIIQYEPGLNASGMTMFGEDGFLIGNEAFTSSAELSKTVLHELYRLNTSASVTGVSAELAAQETKNAFEFAKRAFEELIK